MTTASRLDIFKFKKPMSQPRTTETLLGLLLAVLLSVGALLLTQLFWDALNQTSYVLFFIPVIISAWIGGFIPGVVAGVFSVLLHDIFLLQPVGVFLGSSGDIIRFLVFLLVATLISGLETSRRRSELEAAETRDELLVMMNAIVDGVSATNPAGEIVFANNAAAEIVQFRSSKELREIPVDKRNARLQMFNENREYVPVEQLPRNRVYTEKKPVSETYLMRDNETNVERWVQVTASPVFDKDGEVRLAVNIFRDTTERRQREQDLITLAAQLTVQKARTDNVIRNLPGIVWESIGPGNSGRRVDFISPYVEKMLGYSPDKWIENPDYWQELVPKEDIDEITPVLVESVKTGGTSVLNFRARAADGRLVDIESHTTIIYDAAGEAIGACGVMMDVTERKSQERVLTDAAEALRQSNRELEQFAYVASHDLQEPLRMVTSYLQLLENRLGAALDEESREYIAFAVDGSSRMKKLITDLLIYSRVQRGELEPKPVSMETVFERVKHNLQVAIEESGAEVTHDPLPEIMGDEAQMMQLLQNLVGNGIKFQSEGKPVIHVGVTTRPSEYVFTVKDNGIGIDPKFADRIFVLFQRLHSVGQYSGTGIGLAICKKIVQRHGGNISVASSPGQGSTFTFTIPRQRKVSFKPVNTDTEKEPI